MGAMFFFSFAIDLTASRQPFFFWVVVFLEKRTQRPSFFFLPIKKVCLLVCF